MKELLRAETSHETRHAIDNQWMKITLPLAAEQRKIIVIKTWTMDYDNFQHISWCGITNVLQRISAGPNASSSSVENALSIVCFFRQPSDTPEMQIKTMSSGFMLSLVIS